MGGNKRSAGSFCSLVVSTVLGTSDSVQSLLLATYGDGAECYCAANTSVYRMDGAVVGQPTVGTALVQPASGNGVWVKQGASADLAEGALGTSLLNGAPITGLVVNTWQALPTGTNFYTPNPASNFWSLNTTSGILTYTGPQGLTFLFNGTLGITNSGTVPQTLSIELVSNGALIGSTGNTSTESRVTFPGVIGGTVLLVHNNIMQGNTNSTYQYVIRDLASPNGSFTVEKFQAMITCQI